jgi:magnesium chelatase family protein
MQRAASDLAEVGCGTVVGVEAMAILVQATVRGGSDGAPRILGSVDAVVREAYHRVLGAFVAQGLPSPRGAPLLNFAPAEVRKSGAGFDLPMALALAAAGGVLRADALRGVAAIGELTLDGRVRPVRGVVPIALALRERGFERLLAHPDDAHTAAFVEGLTVHGVESLWDAIQGLTSDCLPPTPAPDGLASVIRGLVACATPLDLADLRGHRTPKGALAVAAAGRHDLLFVGPPGSGKSALVRRLGDLLPVVSPAESVDVLKIRSIAGQDARLSASGRPFRAPHHSSSAASILGGGSDPRPGEVTLAQHGVLFLDELPEFRREVLEGLRQPLEERCVTIGRARGTVTMPADFLLAAAMNPCPCGHATDPRGRCRCTRAERSRYRSRISGPLLDRIDLRVDVPGLPPESFDDDGERPLSTGDLLPRVQSAVTAQRDRNPAGVPNGRLDGPPLEQAFGNRTDAREALLSILRHTRASGRGRVRLMRIARTIADLSGHEFVTPDDVRRASLLRSPLLTLS